ncbi:MAG TPA: ABC transporter permease [Candidatus Limnocylindrales bacterium]|nr:ABC transporter permease [Candidatus Limnocylindrales bacterium]
MLKSMFPSQIALGLAQAAIAAIMALAVVLLARRKNVHLESDAAIALLRGIVQIVAVGSILALLLKAPRWTSVFLLVGMVLAAGSISAKRAKNIPGAAKVSTYSIAAGAGLVTAIMTWAGVIDTAITSLIPVGSMIIANAMNTNGLALNRFRSEVLSHAGEIETALALGAAPEATVARYAESSIHSSLIPAIDNLRSLGIVWIPGLMTGMLLSGANPMYAAIYQFVVIAMILASSGLTSLLSTMMIRSHAFSPADQLVLRGAE